MAKNDWIVAGLNNPEFTTADFVNIADLTTDNTQLLKLDDYLKSDFIKNNPLFFDDSGKFSEQKFTQYYNKRVQDFGDFQQNEFSDRPALDMFDIDRTAETPVQDIHFSIHRGVNPERRTIGIEGINVWGDPVYSHREIAKQNRVYNTEKGEYEDYTVNDHTLVTSPLKWIKDQFKSPLVLATWDEDGEHVDPVTGAVMQHKKGEEKLNELGTYYYETLGGRSVLGKDVLSTFDTFTVDGQGLNKYDFFDSNDIHKSAAGVIAKNVVALLPLFMGPVGGWYATAQIVKELGKTMPMLYGMVTAFTDSETPSWINDLAAIGERYSTSSSDYAKQKTFAFENFGGLISDVALQWGQQKQIAKWLGKAKNANKYIEEAEKNVQKLFDAKKADFIGREAELMTICRNTYMPAAEKMAMEAGALGRDMSLAYMAIISNTDVYEDMLDHGASKLEAAAVAFGSTLGMFGVDKYLGLGEIFFDEATSDATKDARRALKNEFRAARESFNRISQQPDIAPRNKFMQLMSKGADVSKRVMSQFGEDLKYHSLNMVGKMVGEGLEEVSEELVADMSKTLYELAGEFGFDTSTKDVGAWDNAFDRYIMNFLGGFIGGGVFYGKEVWDGKTFHKPKLDEDIATLIRNGHVDELRSQLAQMKKEGKTGSKHLMATDPESTENGLVWRTTDDESKSQSQAIYDMVNARINSIEEVLLANRVNLTDDELFDNMVLSEARYKRYQAIAPIVNIYQDFATVLDKLVNAELAYRQAATTVEGTVNGTAQATIMTDSQKLSDEAKAQRESNLQTLKDNIESARAEVRSFLAGENSLDYTRKLNFAMDPVLHGPFLAVNQEELLNQKYPGKTFQELTPEQQAQFVTVDWPEYVRNQLKTNLSVAWDKYKTLEKTVNPHLTALEQGAPEYKAWVDNLQKLIQTGALNLEGLINSYADLDTQLEGESKEDFENRNKKIISPITGVLETDGEFRARRDNRVRAINAYNDQKDAEWADKVRAELEKVNMRVDPQTSRMLRTIIAGKGIVGNKKILAGRGRLRDILSRKIALHATDPALSALLGTLKVDLSNVQDIIDTTRDTVTTNWKNALEKPLQILANYKVTGSDGTPHLLMDIIAADDTETLNTLTVEELLNGIQAYKNNENTTLEEVFPDIDGVGRGVILKALKTITSPELTVLGDALSSLTSLNIDDVNNTLVNDIATESVLSDFFTEQLQQASESEFNIKQNTINTVVSEIQQNPLYKLQQDLSTSIVNPVSELLKQIAASNNDVLPNVDEVLNTIQNEYDNIQDVHQLRLNDAQRENVEKIKNYLEMLRTYMYAASTVPDTVNPVGHNKTINTFAETHADKFLTPWEKLPEIDSDYVALYQQVINDYIGELDSWIAFSDDNAINQIAKFVRTDQTFNDVLWNILSKMPRTVRVDDKQYDLLAGMDTLDTSLLGTDAVQVPLFNLEKLFYENVKKYAAENNMSVLEFAQKSKLLETMIPGLSGLDNQRRSEIKDTLTPELFSDYDKMIYLITLMSDNPANFFKDLVNRVNTNKGIAPITIQEYSSRVALASLNSTFRDLLKHGRSLMNNQELPLLTNSVIIYGVAGAGKTQVILNAIDSRFKKDTVFIAGPTDDQARLMKNAMNRDKSMSFQTLLTTILGADQWGRIKKAFEGLTKQTYDGDFFSIKLGSDGLAKVRLKLDAIKFADLAEVPKAIYLDEATHLSTLEALLIDAYAAKVGAQVFMCGDPAQIGAVRSQCGVANIDEGAVFAVRTPDLTISLRENNLQKFQNQEAVRSLLNEVLKKRLYSPRDEYMEYFPTMQSIYSTFNFRIYNDTELNGDMITSKIDDKTFSLLQKAVNSGKTIAFIGDAKSATLNELREKGLTIPDKNVLSLASMQGQEYDYVVIDHKFTIPSRSPSGRTFLQQLYTLMTRAREASIFIDNGLSDIIGKNIVSRHKSKAPSILAGIDQLRAKKLDVLKQLNLSTATVKNAEQSDTTDGTEAEPETKKSESKIISNPELDFEDPDGRKPLDNTAKIITDTANEDRAQHDIDAALPVSVVNPDELGNFPIECYGDAYFMGVVEGEPEKRKSPKQTGKAQIQEEEAKEYTARPWKVVVPTEGPLRNLQALVPDGTEAFWYADKLALQKQLNEVRSAIKFQHQYPTLVNPTSLPSSVTNNFSKEAWEGQRKYFLEFRRVDDETLPVQTPFTEKGMTYNGQKFAAVVVCEIPNKKGQLCRFDLAGINNPQTLIDNIGRLKTNLLGKIQSGKLDEKTKEKLQKMHDSVDASAQAYKNWFDQQLGIFNKEGQLSIDVTTAISFNKTTWFRKRTGAPIRLGNRINPSEIDKQDVKNLIDQNPDKSFSPVYTFTGKENLSDFYHIDQSLKGKAVIFVSDDALLKPEQLITEYFAQKRNPDENTPQVRMIVLDNYGMSFSQLTDPRFIKHFQGGDEDRKPYRQNFTGLRMFTSLWNARASLMAFREAYDGWVSEHNWDDTQIDTLLRAQYMAYTNQDGNETVNEQIDQMLAGANLTRDDLKAIDTFNNDLCKNIPMFRLGYSTNPKGFHIQRFNVEGSTAYTFKSGDIPEVNLCVVTAQKAQTMKDMLDAVLNPICPSDKSAAAAVNSLNLRFTKPGEAEGTVIDWEPSEYIDFNDAKHRRSLSGLLKIDSSTLSVNDGTSTLAYPAGDYWSSIPRLLGKMASTIAHYQYNPDTATNDQALNVSFTFLTETGHTADKADQRVLNFSVREFFGENGYLKATTFDAEGNPIIDTSLYDMFNLIFHGTTEDFHRKYSAENPLMQLDDAYFKDGFFINPDISREPNSAGDFDIKGYSDGSQNVVFYEIATDPGLFTCDVDLRSSGVRISLQELLHPTEGTAAQNEEVPKAAPKAGERSPEQIFRENYPEIAGFIDTLNDDGYDFEYSESSISDVIEAHNKSVTDGFPAQVQSGITPDEILNLPYIYVRDNFYNQTLTYRQYLQWQYPGSTIDTSNDTLKIVTTEGTTWQLNTNTGKLEVVQSPAPVQDDQEQQGYISKLMLPIQEGEETTVGQHLRNIVMSAQFVTEVGAENSTITEDAIEDFRIRINHLVDNSEKVRTEADERDKVASIIATLKGEQYNAMRSALFEIDENLHNILFDDCN